MVRHRRRSSRSNAQRGFLPRSSGFAANADRLYKPWRIQIGGNGITGLFRDHQLSDLIGFVYSRMDAKAAAADLHGRLRHLGDHVQSADPLTVCIFLDGENAWEYYPGNGREFLREFYRRIEADQDFRALTCKRSHCRGKKHSHERRNFPRSWINANFDVWIGHAEDVAAWELLWDARQAYARAAEAQCTRSRTTRRPKPPCNTRRNLCWLRRAAIGAGGIGPEHSTANDAEFDALYRKHLTGIYLALGQVAPPISRNPSSANPNTLCKWRRPAF